MAKHTVSLEPHPFASNECVAFGVGETATGRNSGGKRWRGVMHRPERLMHRGEQFVRANNGRLR